MTTQFPTTAPGAPPKLIFDDGSRVLSQAQESGALPEVSSSSLYQEERPRHISVREYYEIDRLVDQVLKIQFPETALEGSSIKQQQPLRVALQFPDELLRDAPEVCWEWEQALGQSFLGEESFFVFVLGDTTHAPCCPDHIAASHLNAQVLVHYGHACLSSSSSSDANLVETKSDTSSSDNECHVLYSFGRCDDCPIGQVASLVKQRARQESVRRILLLYEVKYHYCIEELREAIMLSIEGDDDDDNEDSLTVVTGSLPQQQCSSSIKGRPRSRAAEAKVGSCCQTLSEGGHCCRKSPSDAGHAVHSTDALSTRCSTDSAAISDKTVEGETIEDNQCERELLHLAITDDDDQPLQPHHVIIGGLELPEQVMSEKDGWCSKLGTGYTILFLGADTSRSYLNLVLRFLSSSNHRPDQFWTWTADTGLKTSLSPSFQRTLNRRFYLVQKVKAKCRTLGLLVAHWTLQTRRIVASLQQLVQQQCGDTVTTYTFVVGKQLSPTKLANFPEIDCFVLLACPEHSLLHGERELYAVPIITPLELCMALGVSEWGAVAYSTHLSDYWLCVGRLMEKSAELNKPTLEGKADDDDSDAPFFSLVTGTYESTRKQGDSKGPLDLNALPGHGTLTEYHSAAADFLSQREYQGLTIAADGEEAIHAALPGKKGVASNYNNR